MNDRLIKKKSLSDLVYDHIKKMILSGELKGGERVPEQQLSELFGVSRTPLRDALKKLSDYGLIYLKPRSYAEVVSISEEEAHQIAEVRVNLEIMTCQLFSQRASEELYDKLDELSSSCFDHAMSNDIAKLFEYDSLFHLTIAKNCGNYVLYDIFEKLDARIQLLRLNQKLDLSHLETYIKQHKILIQAMRNKEQKLISSIIQNHIMHDFH